MKHYVLWGLIVAAFFLLSSCGSSKKIQEKSPISTYIMPGADLISGNGILRGWGSGRSDSEASARKKAQMAASAELAAILAKTVESTTEEYSTILSEGMSSESKSLLTDKTKITVNQTLAGATIVFDRWVKDEKTGQFINDIVLELKGDDYLKNLYKELEKNDAATVDRDLLQRLFLKHIDENSKK